MTERDPALQGFDALIGTWDIEAKHRLIEDVVPRARAAGARRRGRSLGGPSSRRCRGSVRSTS